MIIEKVRGYNNHGFIAICICDWCGKEFKNHYSNVKKNKQQFCSIECQTEWRSIANLGGNNPFFGKKHKKETKEKHSKYMIGRMVGNGNPSWSGGRRKSSDNYILIYKPEHPLVDSQNCVREHRLVMENILGRYLKKEEIVHHRNEIVDDNYPENLMLFANDSEHKKYHAKQRKLSKGDK